jgi:uncharacterized membrane protein YbhN (UPF0104 family)
LITSIAFGRPWVSWSLSVLLSLGIFAYLFSQIDPAELVDAARSLAPRPLVWFGALVIGGVTARAVRYWILLGRAVSLKRLVAITLARNLFVDLLPARTGELSYVYLVTQRAGRPLEDAVASLLLVLLFDVFALAPLLIIAALIVGGSQLPIEWVVVTGAGLALGSYGAIWASGPIAARAAALLDTSRSGSHRAALVEKLRELGRALVGARSRRIFLPVLALSIVVRLCKFGSYFFLVLAIMVPLGYTAAGLGVSRVFLGVVAAELSAALPIHGIAGFGTFEAIWAVSFTQLGFSRDHAIISGILTHTVSQVVEYSLGACAFLYLMRPVVGR